MSSKDKVLISDMMESFVSEVPAKPFVTFCVVCNKGVISEDMMYEKGRVFHKDCYDKYGENFPAINQDLLSQSTNAKVELVQLKNLKVRMTGTNPSSSISRPKTTKKSKRKNKDQKDESQRGKELLQRDELLRKGHHEIDEYLLKGQHEGQQVEQRDEFQKEDHHEEGKCHSLSATLKNL